MGARLIVTSTIIRTKKRRIKSDRGDYFQQVLPTVAVEVVIAITAFTVKSSNSKKSCSSSNNGSLLVNECHQEDDRGSDPAGLWLKFKLKQPFSLIVRKSYTLI